MKNVILTHINDLLKVKPFILAAIDGRCASGKSTLASELEKELDCNVIHMDDFFLRPEQRTEKRLGIPGENIDHERFLSEVLIPLRRGENFIYRPFRCHEGNFGEPIEVKHKKVTVIEGSYSLHNLLREHYDLRIFCDTDYATQLERIRIRNGDIGLERFKNMWIPLEEKYFATGIKEICHIVTGGKKE